MRRLGIITATCLLATLFAGCTAEPEVDPDPQPSFTPVFASQDAAVAEAQRVLQLYFDASNLLAQSGGNDLSGFDGIVSDKQLQDEKDAAKSFLAAGERSQGDLFFTDFKLQQYKEDGPPLGAYLQAYFCQDLTNFVLLSSNGDVLNVEGSVKSSPYEVVFDSGLDEPTFVIEEVKRWTGRNFCNG